jgi:hypothetical protein
MALSVPMKARHAYRTAPLKAVDGSLLIDASYNLAGGSLAIATTSSILQTAFKDKQNAYLSNLSGKLNIVKYLLGLFGAFLTFQTATIRFQFSDTGFSLVKADGSSIGDNIVVGGKNEWAYDSFVNYDFLPGEDFPVLVYFKETQTPRDAWVETPIIVDKAVGQQHFFPAIANVQQLKQNFESHGCKKIPKGEVELDVTKKMVL